MAFVKLNIFSVDGHADVGSLRAEFEEIFADVRDYTNVSTLDC